MAWYSPLASLLVNLLILSLSSNLVIGASILRRIRDFAGFPFLLVKSPELMAVVLLQFAPRNIKPSLVAVIRVLS